MNVPSISHINISFQNKRWRKGTFSRLEESHVTEHKAGDYSDIYIRVDFRLLEPAGMPVEALNQVELELSETGTVTSFEHIKQEGEDTPTVKQLLMAQIMQRKENSWSQILERLVIKMMKTNMDHGLPLLIVADEHNSGHNVML